MPRYQIFFLFKSLALSAFLSSCGSGSNQSSTPSNDLAQSEAINEDESSSFFWEVVDPEEAGFDAEALENAFEYAFDERFNTQALLIVRGGKIVAEKYSGISQANIDGLVELFSEVRGWGSSLSREDWQERYGLRDQFSLATSWSTAKSVASTLIGIAIAQDFIDSVDQPASDFLPNWLGTDKEGRVSIRDILTMKSGLQCPDGPNGGEIYNEENQLDVAINRVLELSTAEPDEKKDSAWVYCNADSMLLGEIIENATGYSAYEFGDRFLFAPLGMRVDWWRDTANNYLTYCCIDAISRDFARFGLLWLSKGVWEGQNLFSEKFFDAALSQSDIAFEQDNLGYGFQWYIQSLFNDDNETIRELSFGTKGFHMNNIWLFPDLDLVVVRNSLYHRVLDAIDDTVRTGDLELLFQGEDMDVNVHATLAPYNAMLIRGQFYPYNTDNGVKSLSEDKLISDIIKSIR